MAAIGMRSWKLRGEIREAWRVSYRDQDNRLRFRQFRVREAAERFRERAEYEEQMRRADRAVRALVKAEGG